jgi:1-acyl-sn-glycerol-3-phosphate acyltransferase
MNRTASELPRISRWQLRLFNRYVGFYLRRHFHRFYLSTARAVTELESWPILVCMNHPSWWDPLFAIRLSQNLFPQRMHYGPIASQALAKYRFFEKLGFFGIAPEARSGASRFLHIGRVVLSNPNGALWVTAQGRFTDVRARPVQLQPGIAHLARSSSRFAVIPLALEYSFWAERTPDCYAYAGTPIYVEDGKQRSTAQWADIFSTALEHTQDALAEHVISHTTEDFELLISGTAGVGGTYDLWRRLKAIACGKRFRAEHGVDAR